MQTHTRGLSWVVATSKSGRHGTSVVAVDNTERGGGRGVRRAREHGITGSSQCNYARYNSGPSHRHNYRHSRSTYMCLLLLSALLVQSAWLPCAHALGSVFVSNKVPAPTWSNAHTIAGGEVRAGFTNGAVAAASTLSITASGTHRKVSGAIVAVWEVANNSFSGEYSSLYSARSTDGKTWEGPTLLSHGPLSDDSYVSSPVVAAGQGTFACVWMAVATSSPITTSSVLYSLSHDNGETWSDASRVFGAYSETSGTSFPVAQTTPSIATDEHGTWAIAWVEDYSVNLIISQDGTKTWKKRCILSHAQPSDSTTATTTATTTHRDTDTNRESGRVRGVGGRERGVSSVGNGNSTDTNSTALYFDFEPVVASHKHKQSTLLVAVTTRRVMPEPSLPSIAIARSVDSGDTWSTYVELKSDFGYALGEPTVGANSDGTWVVVATVYASPYSFLAMTSSKDDGVSWPPLKRLLPNSLLHNVSVNTPHLTWMRPLKELDSVFSLLMVRENGEKNSTILSMHSYDCGSMWTMPSEVVHPHAGDEVINMNPVIANGEANEVMALWLMTSGGLSSVQFATAVLELPPTECNKLTTCTKCAAAKECLWCTGESDSVLKGESNTHHCVDKSLVNGAAISCPSGAGSRLVLVPSGCPAIGNLSWSVVEILGVIFCVVSFFGCTLLYHKYGRAERVRSVDLMAKFEERAVGVKGEPKETDPILYETITSEMSPPVEPGWKPSFRSQTQSYSTFGSVLAEEADLAPLSKSPRPCIADAVTEPVDFSSIVSQKEVAVPEKVDPQSYEELPTGLPPPPF